MSQRRRSIARLGGAWVLALLLLVPLVFAGHHHSPEQVAASHSCAACTVTHAAFASPTAPAMLAALEVAHHPISLPTVDVVVPLDQDDHHGRAPPAASARRPL